MTVEKEKHMIYVLLADGFEEIEALTPIDILRRGGFSVTTVGVTGKAATGSHGITVSCDVTGKDAFRLLGKEPPEMLILPGGMPGTRHIDSWDGTDDFIKATVDAGGYLAAICAAPSVLGKRGLLSGRKAVCYPGFEKYLGGVETGDEKVVRDGMFITARGAGCAMDFALELLSVLRGNEAAREIANSVIYR